MADNRKLLLVVFLLASLALIPIVLSWYDLSYAYRGPITNNFTNSYGVYSVNDTSGVGGNIYWANISNSVSYVYTNTTNFRQNITIASDTALERWENQSTRLGNNVFNMWNATGAIMVWHMDDASCTNPKDSAQYGTNGTSASTSSVAAVFGNGCSFNGAASITASGTYTNSANNSLSIEAWLNPTNNNVAFVWDKRDGSGNEGFYLYNDGTGKYVCAIYTGSTENAVTTNVTITVGKWTHFACVYDGQNVKVYVNSTLACTSCTGASGTAGQSSDTVYFGERYTTASKWTGSIDEFRIYTRGLDPDELKGQFYNGNNNMTRVGAAEAAPTVTLNITPASPVNYGVATNASCLDSGAVATLYRNGTNVSATENNTYIKLPAGAWNYTCAQFSPYSSVKQTYVVNKITPVLNVSIKPSQNISFGTQSSATCVANSNATSYLFQRTIVINSTFNTTSNYQVPLNITWDSNMLPDFSDLLFANSTANLSYWIESYSASSWAYVWVNIPQLVKNGNNTIVMYYGNNTPVVSQSNITATAFYYNPCDTASDVSKWNQICGFGSGGISLDTVNKYSGAGSCKFSRVQSGNPYQAQAVLNLPSNVSGVIAKIRSKFSTSSGDQNFLGLGFGDQTAGVGCVGFNNQLEYYGYWRDVLNLFATNLSGTVVISNSLPADWVMSTQQVFLPDPTYNFTYSNAGTFTLYQNEKSNNTVDWLYVSITGNGFFSINYWLDDVIVFKYGGANLTYSIGDERDTGSVPAAGYKNGILMAQNNTPFDIEVATLGIGTYTYKCNITDLQNYTYTFDEKNLTVTGITPTINLTFSPTSPVTYETKTTATCLSNSGGFTNLYRNGTNVTFIENNTLVQLPAGNWTYICNSTAGGSYVVGSTTQYYNVNQKNANVQVFPITQTITYPASVTQYCTDDSKFYDCKVYRNDILLVNNTAIILGAGSYTYRANITDQTNYTNYQDVQNLVINQGTISVSLLLNGLLNQNKTITYPTYANASVVTASNQDNLLGNLFRNGTLIPGGSEYVLLPEANYEYKVNLTGNANYSDNTGLTRYLFVAGYTQIFIQHPVNNSYQLLYPNQSKTVSLNYTTTGNYPKTCFYSFDNGGNISRPACDNTTYALTQIGNHSVTVFANQTFSNALNFTTNNFYIDFANIWTVTDAGGNPISATVTITNGTGTVSQTNANGIIIFNTSQLPFGSNVSITVEAPNYITQFFVYTINNATQISATVPMFNSGLLIKVIGENTLSPIKFWKVWMNNGTSDNPSYATQLSVGKGYPAQPYSYLIDGNLNTSVQNLNDTTYGENFTYNFGFTDGYFQIFYEITGNTSTNNSIIVQGWNITSGNFVNVFNSNNSGSTNGVVSSIYIVDNDVLGGDVANFGDLFTAPSACEGTYCPLFQLKLQPDSNATIKVYEIRLVYPYQYDENGFATVNFTNFNLVQGTSRFTFESNIQGLNSLNDFGRRTYFVTPTVSTATQLYVYLNPSCYPQKFQIFEFQTGTSNPITVSNALLSVYRQFGATTSIIDQQLSDIAGIATLCVQGGFPYTFTVAAAGFQTYLANQQVWSNTGDTYNIYLSKTTGISAYHNPVFVSVNITPTTYLIENATLYTCLVQSPYPNVLQSNFQVTYQNINGTYPPNIANATNGTGWMVFNYPPGFNYTSLPFNLDQLGVGAVLVNSTIYSPFGSVFNFNATVPGYYNISCGAYFVPQNDTGPLNGSYGVYTVFNQIKVFYLNQGSIANAGKNLSLYVQPMTLYVIGLMVDMIITSFFIVKFGMRSAIVFLLVWGMIITILGGWGFNPQSALAVAGLIVWLTLEVFPYEKKV